MSCLRGHVHAENTEKQSKDFMLRSNSESWSHLCFWVSLWLQRGESFEENYYWRVRVYLEDFHCHSEKRCGCLKNKHSSVLSCVQWSSMICLKWQSERRELEIKIKHREITLKKKKRVSIYFFACVSSHLQNAGVRGHRSCSAWDCNIWDLSSWTVIKPKSCGFLPTGSPGKSWEIAF